MARTQQAVARAILSLPCTCVWTPGCHWASSQTPDAKSPLSLCTLRLQSGLPNASSYSRHVFPRDEAPCPPSLPAPVEVPCSHFIAQKLPAHAEKHASVRVSPLVRSLSLDVTGFISSASWKLMGSLLLQEGAGTLCRSPATLGLSANESPVPSGPWTHASRWSAGLSLPHDRVSFSGVRDVGSSFISPGCWSLSV